MLDEILQIVADRYKLDSVSFKASEKIAGVEKNTIFVIFNKIKDGHIIGVYIICKDSEKEMKKELRNILNNGFTKPFKEV